MNIKLFQFFLLISIASANIVELNDQKDSSGENLKVEPEKYGRMQMYDSKDCTGKLYLDVRHKDKDCPPAPVCVELDKNDENNIIKKNVFVSYSCIETLEDEINDFETRFVKGIQFEDKKTCEGKRVSSNGFMLNKCFKGTKYSCNKNNEVVVKLYHDKTCQDLKDQTIVPACNDGHRYSCHDGKKRK